MSIFGLQKDVIERGLGAAKGDEQGGIELPGIGFQDESLGLHVSQAGLVDKLGAQRIIDIGNRDNARGKRNGVAAQSVGGLTVRCVPLRGQTFFSVSWMFRAASSTDISAASADFLRSS